MKYVLDGEQNMSCHECVLDINKKIDILIQLMKKVVNKELRTDMQIDQVIDLLHEI